MATIEDILSNPGSSVVFVPHRFYYAIGNTPSVDLTEGCEVPSDVLLLLLGCGDIRNILQTVLELNQIKPIPKSLTFHVNDIDDVLLARNAVLMQIVNTIDTNKREDVEFVWNVWYNLQLSERHFQRLKSALSDILENPLGCLKFESQHCASAVKAVVQYWLKMKLDVREVQSQRELFIRKKAAADNNLPLEEMPFPKAVELLFQFSKFIADSGDISQPLTSETISKEIRTYFRTGSTNTLSLNSYANSTFLCPHINGWRVHPGSLPYEGFNDLMLDQSLTENCIQQLQTQLKSWTAYRRNGGIIKVCLWAGDALTLCNRTMPPDMKFHFINTSNLFDQINPLNVLLACSKRLKRSGVLSVQTLNWTTGGYGSIEKMLDVRTGIPPYFYPTFLGLHLAENFELGTSKRPTFFLSSTVNDRELRWIAAEVCLPGIDVAVSHEVVEILERVAKLCFNVFDPTDKDPLNTPLTLVYLIKQLATNIDGGVKPLLDIVERCLPTEVTRTGERFRPLAMEWKVLKLFHFRDELDLKLDDALVEVQLPVMMKVITAPKPAGVSLIHRVVVAEQVMDRMTFLQGQCASPWIALTSLDFDNTTGIMRCIVPSSDLETIRDKYMKPFRFDGLPSVVAPKAPLNMSNIHCVTMKISTDTKTRSENASAGETHELNLTLCETRNDYSVTIKAAKQDTVLKSFEVHVDSKTMRRITAVCEISKFDVADTAEIQLNVSCPVDLLRQKRYTGTDTVQLVKSTDYVQGPMILPQRRMDISQYPSYATSKQYFFRLLGQMFLTSDELNWKTQGSQGSNTLFQVKETIQMMLQRTCEPSKHQPSIRSYRIFRAGRPMKEVFRYFPEDIFVGVRNLHNVRGIPTLDVVWMDFEIYGELIFGKDVCQQSIASEEAERFLDENGGISNETCHHLTVSSEECILLKKFLRINSSRSVQKSDESGSPEWRFNSFIQPNYSITAKLDMLNLLCSEAGHQKLERHLHISRSKPVQIVHV